MGHVDVFNQLSRRFANVSAFIALLRAGRGSRLRGVRRTGRSNLIWLITPIVMLLIRVVTEGRILRTHFMHRIILIVTHGGILRIVHVEKVLRIEILLKMLLRGRGSLLFDLETLKSGREGGIFWILIGRRRAVVTLRSWWMPESVVVIIIVITVITPLIRFRGGSIRIFGTLFHIVRRF